jgi:alkanesulfonate monooxygenase SsuD/methylene tetrahydromethanopterin reductase-like flavin-dependent oxidoreductase (luciferase family)
VETTGRIAPGRVIAGIGAGDSESREENETFGLGFGTMSDRIARLDAAVRASCGHGARVWVGGQAAAVLDVAATSADGWNAWGEPPVEFEAHVASLRAVAVREDFECTWGGLAVLATSDDAAQEKAARLGPSTGTLVGSPATVAGNLRAFVEAGADWLIVAPVDSRDAGNVELLGEVRALVRG